MLAETPNWLIVSLGGVVALYGLWKIIETGVALLFWVILVIGGIGGVQYGWQKGSVDPAALTSEMVLKGLHELSLLEKDAAMEKISALCRSWTDKPSSTKQASAIETNNPPPPPVQSSQPAPPLPASPSTPSGRFR